jgi:hypothetical protein
MMSTVTEVLAEVDEQADPDRGLLWNCGVDVPEAVAS